MNLPPLDARRARQYVQRFGRLDVLVVGDVLLDRFIVGDVTRISPEAPVPVVRFQSEYGRLGGAANVAHNLATLGARVSLVGLTGVDAGAERLRILLDSAGLSADGLIADRDRPTVEKLRIVTTRNQQVARIDYENDADAAGGVEDAIVEAIERRVQASAVVVVSDYLKGAVTRAVMRAIVDLRRPDAPLVVDPKIPHLDRYAGATIVTQNHHEAEVALARRIQSDEDAREAGIDFRHRTGCEAAVITRGEHGMWVSGRDVEGAIPAVAREVSDVTGAGDTVVATLALALAAGAPLADAALLANYAAGVVVAKFGPATLTPQELLSGVR
jgi:D-beta-D-heptose 7-phosphate kinase/D-beta-D-heptose 1-phosphate adenosyltransferase